MTPSDRAALREAAQAVLDTQGHDPEVHAYTRLMSGIHPVAVLALLDECERMREALQEIFAVGDGWSRNTAENYAGTTGEGHAKCREIARAALGEVA